MVFERYETLVRSITRTYRLPVADMEDVSQTVWLKLLEHIDELRAPAALPGWIAATTAKVCRSEVNLRNRAITVDPLSPTEAEHSRWRLLTSAPEDAEPGDDVLRNEVRRAIKDGLAELPPKQRHFLLLLMADPPVPYAQIGRWFGMPIGSIGPTRARCLNKLRRTAAVRRLIDPDAVDDAGMAA
ncbi:sigma-70 family RNA polymerase sigma factor [Kribbella sp. NBC_00359]|uniref:sigma-70 family RNA polymerase sigma factor n=1 Tax=Kribbella sp. NBC_00359 TaxID=2975966 RepID=UPI002E1FDB2C